MVDDVAQPRGRCLRQPEDHEHSHDKEDDHRRNLDEGEPELELAEPVHAQQVDAGEGHQEDQRHEPGRGHRPHGVQHGGGRRGLGCHDDDELDPPDPSDGEAHCRAHRSLGIDGKRPGVRVGRHHLAKHVHDGNDEQPGDHISDQHRRAGCCHALS